MSRLDQFVQDSLQSAETREAQPEAPKSRLDQFTESAIAANQPDYQTMPWSEALKTGAKGFAFDVPDALKDTATGIYDLAIGAKNLPVRAMTDPLGLAGDAKNMASGAWDAVSGAASDPSGTWNKVEPQLKQYVAEKPAHAGMDVGMALMAPEYGLAKLGVRASRNPLTYARHAVDPISQVDTAARVGLPVANRAANEALGHFFTGTGAEGLNMAAHAGYEGGTKSANMAKGLNSEGNPADLVKSFRQAVADYRRDRKAKHDSDKAAMATDKQQLDIQPAFNEFYAQNREFTKTPAGTTGVTMPNQLANDTLPMRQAINDKLTDWQLRATWQGRTQPGVPNEFFTPSGFDHLKRELDSLRDQPGLITRPESEVILNRVVEAVRKELKDKSPHYASYADDYERASNDLRAFEKELHLKDQGNPGTALRKLISSLNNNVTANYGLRQRLVEMLRGRNSKADDAMYGLAGQQLSANWPRGLVNQILSKGSPIGIGALGAYMATPWAWAAAPALWAMQSPRLMGHMNLLSGKIGRQIEQVPWRGLGYAGHLYDLANGE